MKNDFRRLAPLDVLTARADAAIAAGEVARSTNLRDLALRPRAVAILVALRKGPRRVSAIADAIAEDTKTETLVMLRSVAERGLIQSYDTQSAVWGLTYDGLGWLQGQGLDASESAKQALYAATDAQTAAR
jgi:hypothetical protein